MTVKQKTAVGAATAGISLLTAIVTLYASGAIQRWTWTPPTTGSDAVAYRVRAEFTVDANQTFFLAAFKDSLRLQVAGIDSLGRCENWSEVGMK